MKININGMPVEIYVYGMFYVFDCPALGIARSQIWKSWAEEFKAAPMPTQDLLTALSAWCEVPGNLAKVLLS